MAKKNNYDDDSTEYYSREQESDDYKSDDSETMDEDDYHNLRNSYDSDDEGEQTVNLKRQKPEILGFIVVKKGRRKNDKHDLTKNDVIIGKSSKCCDIVLDDDEVSKIHCRIRRDPEMNEFHFYDCGSTNGSKVNGSELQHVILKSHDKITIGESVELVFVQV